MVVKSLSAIVKNHCLVVKSLSGVVKSHSGVSFDFCIKIDHVLAI